MSTEIVTLLKDLSSRLAAIESAVGTADGGAVASAAAPAAAAASGETSEFLEKYDELCADKLAAFQAASKAVGGDAKKLAKFVKGAFDGVRVVIAGSISGAKPADLAEPFAKNLKKFNKFREEADFKKHFKAVQSSMEVAGCVGSATPAAAARAVAESTEYYTNGVKIDQKGNDEHIAWAKAFDALLGGLGDFYEAQLPEGLTWSADAMPAMPAGDLPDMGMPAMPSMPGGAGMPAMPAMVMPALGKDDGGGTDALFAAICAIDQTSGRTAGLRKVTKDADGNRIVVGEKKRKVPKKKRKSSAKPGKKKAAVVKAVKPPRCEYEVRNKTWFVENQLPGTEIVVDTTTNAQHPSTKQKIFVCKCEGATVTVTGKFMALTIDGCTKTKVIVDEVLSTIETVNCQRIKVQVDGDVPSIAIDKTDGVMITLARSSMGVGIVTSKSSEMNVQFPGLTDDDDWVEQAIPEQFFHEIVTPEQFADKTQETARVMRREHDNATEQKQSIYSRISDLYHAC